MKLYKYTVIFDNTIDDIKIDSFIECDVDIFDKKHIRRNLPKGIETIYEFSHASYIKLVPDVVINSVAYPMYESAIINGKPSHYCIFTDTCDDEKNLKLFKKLIFYNSFSGYTNVYG